MSELSWEELSAQVGHTRQSLVKWRKLPGAPSDRDPEKWKAFIATGALGKNSGQELKDDKLRHEIEILKARLAREHRSVIPRDEVNQLFLHISSRAKTMLYQFLETEAPPKLDGLGAAQIRPILREMADSIADEMAGLIDRFQKQ